MTYTIRLAAPDDGEGIATLFMKVWHSMEPMLPSGFLDKFDHDVQREKYAARAIDPAWLLLVAEQQGIIIGIISATASHGEPQGFEQQIKAMYVDPAHQRLGIGTALLKAISKQLQKKHIKNLALWCIAHNDNACAFYEKHGARKITGLPLPEEYSAMPHVVYAWDNII